MFGICLVLSWGTTASRAQVLTTIAIDGDMSDWSAVLADPFQNAYDGPALGLLDRDAPVQSTGRDLEGFAWTYDGTHVYFYVRRAASTSNQQYFWYYIDTDEDGLMETGEPVVGVDWKGSNRTTTVSLYSYVAAAPGGDPLGDPSGFADGWTMAGTVLLVQGLEAPKGGANNGVEMESRVSWALLGVAAGTPLKFHVSASNSTNIPHQIDDNMGGPGGLVGTTRFAGVSITPDQSGTVVPGGDLACPHVVANTGQSADTFNLTWSSSGSFVPAAVSYWHDVNGDGQHDTGDTPLVDTTGDGLPDTGSLAAGSTLAVIALITAPAGIAAGDAADVVSTATSFGSPSVSDGATDAVTVVVPAVTLVKSVDLADADPGTTLTYTVVYTSAGPVDALNVVVLDAVPADTDYIAGSATGVGALIEWSHDGGSNFDGSEAAPVTHVRWTLLNPLAPSDSGTLTFQVALR